MLNNWCKLASPRVQQPMSEGHSASYAELFDWLKPGQLLSHPSQDWLQDWQHADPHAFGHSSDAQEHDVSRY